MLMKAILEKDAWFSVVGVNLNIEIENENPMERRAGCVVSLYSRSVSGSAVIFIPGLRRGRAR